LVDIFQKENEMQVKTDGSLSFQKVYRQPLTKDEFKSLKEAVELNANKYTFKDFAYDNAPDKKLFGSELALKNSQDFQKFLYDNGIDGVHVRRISELDFGIPTFFDTKA
jgi:hypothetical protein